ncbi:hypothetical protein BGZ59_004803, partial [Podila verticillata]
YSRFSAEPPSGQLNPILPKTYRVLDAVYEQVLPLFPDSTFHSGSDEVNFNCWNTTASITEYMDSKGIPRTEAGVITGSADYWYLDCGFGDWLGNWTLGVSWCDPYKSWQKIYSFNPLQGLSAKEAKSVLGGEALLWGEQVDDTNLDTKLWPRASAAAEVLWSGNSDDSDTGLWNGTDQDEDTLRNVEALTRINEHRFRMLSEQISAEPLQPLWCVQHPGHCLWPIYDAKPEKQPY